MKFIADLAALAPRSGGRGTAVMLDALGTANSTAAQALDESVLNALGQLQGKERPDFVNQVIIIFLETALALLADLKWGSEGSVLDVASGQPCLERVRRHHWSGIVISALRRVGNGGASR